MGLDEGPVKRWIWNRYGLHQFTLHRRSERRPVSASLDLLPCRWGAWALGLWFEPDDEDGQRTFQAGVVVAGVTISWDPTPPRWRGWWRDRKGRRVVRAAERELRKAARPERDFEEQAGGGVC